MVLKILKTSKVYCIPVLEARNSRLRSEQSPVLSDSSGADPFLASSGFYYLIAFLGILGLSTHHSSHMADFSLCVLMVTSLCAYVSSVQMFPFL